MSENQQVIPGTFNSEIPIPEEWPKWLKNISIAAEVVSYGGETFTYAVVRNDFNETAKSLYGFAAYIEGYTLISTDVPCGYRPYFALHEIIEMKKLAGERGCCVKALKIELAEVPEEILLSYVTYRRAFFARLVKFREKEKHDPDEIAETRASLRYLTRLST